MQRFHFRLKGLMRIKQSLEKEVRRQLMEIQQLCLQKEGEIKETDLKVSEWSNYYNEVLSKRVNATELAVMDRHLQNLYRYKEQLVIGLEILGRKKEDLMQFYQEVKKEVKMLEHIREKKWAEYRELLRKEEEKIADEMATLRFSSEMRAL